MMSNNETLPVRFRETKKFVAISKVIALLTTMGRKWMCYGRRLEMPLSVGAILGRIK
jgi:hypothetical protein